VEKARNGGKLWSWLQPEIKAAINPAAPMISRLDDNPDSFSSKGPSHSIAS
jgi:hypothetical protein